MKWWPDEPKSGDMIRVPLGQVYHYGVFVSEDEVIQFGPPPVSLIRDDSQLEVCVTDMTVFSCGKIIEVALLTPSEKKKRLSPEKTVAAARNRIGENGYNLLHNNCEHFAYECVFGIRHCEQEDQARARWNNRPILDVYCSPADAYSASIDDISSPAVRKELQRARSDTNDEIAAWLLLQYGLKRSLGMDIADLDLKKHFNGKWTCSGAFFSMACIDGYVAVAVSNGDVGIHAENPAVFASRYSNDAEIRKALSNICQKSEFDRKTIDTDMLMRAYCIKKSVYKASGQLVFKPKTITIKRDNVRCFRLQDEAPVFAAVCGDRVSALRVWQQTGGNWILVKI